MPKPKTKQVAKRDTNDLSYLSTNTGDLGVNFEAGDTQTPRLKICQKMSDSAKETNPDLKDGDFYTNLTCESLGSSINFFNLLHWNSTSWFGSEDGKFLGTVYKNPVNGEVVKQGEAIESILANRDQHEDEITMFQNYMVALESELKAAIKTGSQPQVYILSCASAAIKYARQMNAKILMNARSKRPIYAQLFNAETFVQKFKKGTAYMPKFSWPRYATPEEFEVLKMLYDGAKFIHTSQDINNVADEQTEDDSSDDSEPL